MERKKAPGSEKGIASLNQTLHTNTNLMKYDGEFLPREKVFSCKICHDEDEHSNMETPCSCSGTLKYAHRECVQRWCNEKGDTTCEICQQQFEPGYTAPPQTCLYGGLPLNIRENWEHTRRNWNDHQFIDMVATDYGLLDSDYGDYAAISSTSLLCCRVITLIFLVLLSLRLTIPILSGASDNTITFFMSLMLSCIGIFIPIYAMVKAFNSIKFRRNQQEIGELGIRNSDEENELPRQVHHRMHLIHVV